MAGVAGAIESLPLEDWDNFLTPVGTACVVGLLTALWPGLA